MNGSSTATVALISAPATTHAAAPASRRLEGCRHHQAHRGHHREHHDQVVVGTAERVQHVQRVGADDEDREHRIQATGTRAAPGQRERAGAREQRLELHAPQRADHAERRERIGEQRVKRAVRRGDAVPVAPDVAEDRVVMNREGAVRVGIQAVLNRHAGVGDVAEHVGRDQDRTGEHDQLQHRDERDRPAFGDHAARVARLGAVGDGPRTTGDQDQPEVGAARDEQRDQEDAIAETLAGASQPARDLRRLRDQRREPSRPVDDDLRRGGYEQQREQRRERGHPPLRADIGDTTLALGGDTHGALKLRARSTRSSSRDRPRDRRDRARGRCPRP